MCLKRGIFRSCLYLFLYAYGLFIVLSHISKKKQKFHPGSLDFRREAWWKLSVQRYKLFLVWQSKKTKNFPCILFLF